MDEISFLVLIFGIGNLVFFGLLMLVKKLWYFWDVKNCVDVQIFYIGENSVKRRFINCVKKNRTEDSGFETYDLKPFPHGKEQFEFNTRFSILRKDGKDTIDYVDIQGKKIPIMPHAEITYGMDGEYSIKSVIADVDWTYSSQTQDKIIEYTMRDQFQKIKNASKLRGSGLSTLQMVLIGISVLLIIGLVIYWVFAKTGGGGGAAV